ESPRVAARRLTGGSGPAWLDEGLATTVEAGDAFGADRATALSLLANDPAVLTIFGDERSSVQENTDFGGHAYGVAAEAVRVMLDRIGRPALVPMLQRM